MHIHAVHRQDNPGHVCTRDPADCFIQCESCSDCRVPEPMVAEEEELPLDDVYHADPVILQSPAGTPPTPLPRQDPLPGPAEVIHVLAPSLFEQEYPYKLFLGNYWILDPIVVLFLAFQTISSVFITLCEDGGAYAVFHDGSVNAAEFINRVITLNLRILVRVVVPFVFYRQICSMAEDEKELEIKRKKKDYDLPPPNPVPYHQHVNLWSIVSHAVIFSFLLFYLGAFLTAEDRLKDKSICIRELFQVQVPLIGMRLFVFFDCVSCFFILMLVGLVKDCYCIENRLSTANDKYFNIIRKRWYRIDLFCYTTPLLLVLFATLSLSCGKPITPTPNHQLYGEELEMWCFWMIVLSLLQFFAASSNPIARIVTMIGNALLLSCAIFFTLVLGVDKVSFPPGSFVILLYSFLSMSTLNLLYCLTKAHARHKKLKSRRLWLSLTCLILLTLSLLVIVIREIISLAVFVAWA